MNYKSDSVNKDLNLSKMNVDRYVDDLQRADKFVSEVNEIVNKTRGRLLTLKSLCLNDFFNKSTMSTKILIKVYEYKYSTYYMPYTRARVGYLV